MGAIGQGIIANLVGILIMWAAGKGIIIPDGVRDQLIALAGNSLSSLLAIIGTVFLGLSQWLIHKAKKEMPPAPKPLADPDDQIVTIRNQNGTTTEMTKRQLDQSGFVRPQMLVPLWCIAVILALGVTLLPGCANLTPAQQQQQMVLAVQVATMTYIEAEADPVKRHQRAANIVMVADAGTHWIDGQDVTLDNLTLLAMDRINSLQLEPSQRALAMGLVNYVDLQLQMRISQGLLSADDKATVSALLKTVSTAAQAY